MKQLLNQNKLTTNALQIWFTEKMAANVASANLSEELAASFQASVISVDKLAAIVGTNPRSLFDFFDEHGVYILPIMEGDRFSCTINGNSLHVRGFVKTRAVAEDQAVKEAFPFLEGLLIKDLQQLKKEQNEREEE